MPFLSSTTVLTIAVWGETFYSASFMFNLKVLNSFHYLAGDCKARCSQVNSLLSLPRHDSQMGW